MASLDLEFNDIALDGAERLERLLRRLCWHIVCDVLAVCELTWFASLAAICWRGSICGGISAAKGLRSANFYLRVRVKCGDARD
eukprot:3344202-Rhodomonas_salina.2